MRLFCLFAAMLWMVTSDVAAANPCTNGSFEELDANSFAVDWQPIGRHVEVSGDDVHSGQRALRMVRSADESTPDELAVEIAKEMG